MFNTSAAISAVKNGVTAIAVGTGVAIGGDYLYSELIMPVLNKGSSSLTNLALAGKLLVGGVVAGASGSIVMYVGDQAITQIMGDDFLGHMIFYQSVFFQSQLFQITARDLRQALGVLIGSPGAGGPPRNSGPKVGPQKPPSQPVPSETELTYQPNGYVAGGSIFGGKSCGSCSQSGNFDY